jgi:hypothetical protein
MEETFRHFGARKLLPRTLMKELCWPHIELEVDKTVRHQKTQIGRSTWLREIENIYIIFKNQ